jgi:TolB-like protein
MDLVVLNFVNHTPGERAQEFQPWELGLASMMMTDLESMGLFNIITKEDVSQISRKRGIRVSRLQTEADALKVGELVAAKYALSGSFVEMNGKLRIEARVFSIEQGTQLGAGSVTGKTDKFFELQKSLVLEISKYMEAMLDETEASVITRTVETTSVHASLNNYAGEIAVLQAQEYKERGEPRRANQLLEKAKERFQIALKHDPDYKRAKQNLAKLAMGIPLTL